MDSIDVLIARSGATIVAQTHHKYGTRYIVVPPPGTTDKIRVLTREAMEAEIDTELRRRRLQVDDRALRPAAAVR
jgi:hypothetical protein